MPNITNFKTALANGGARPNQFKVFIPFPTGEANENEQLLVSGAALPASTVNPVITQFTTITIINNENQTLRRLFEDWMELINNKEDNSGETEWLRYQQDVIVEHLDRNDKPLTGGKYKLKEAFPINMSEIALQYAQNDIIEEFTVTFQYQTYEVS